MEIRGVNTTLINNYPKSEEITKKKVKTSFLSKWKKIGITYGLVYNIIIHKVYGNQLLHNIDEMTLSGFFPIERDEVYTIEFLGKTREISESTYNLIPLIESNSLYALLFLLAIIAVYIIWSILHYLRHKEKPKFGVGIKIIIALAIILGLAQLVLRYMIVLTMSYV